MKPLLTALLLAAAAPSQLQQQLPASIWNQAPKRTPDRVYATYDDMLKDHPVDGIVVDNANPTNEKKLNVSDKKAEQGITRVSYTKLKSIMLVENGQAQERQLKDLSYWGYTDAQGKIFRIHKETALLCVVLGDKCSYYQGVRIFNYEYSAYPLYDWVAEGRNGPIKEGAGHCERMIKNSSMKDELMESKPKRVMKEPLQRHYDNYMEWYTESFRRINGPSLVE
ncbi:MAG: hypothetical protein R2817_07470 [Flavobacteriales bacterium]